MTDDAQPKSRGTIRMRVQLSRVKSLAAVTTTAALRGVGRVEIEDMVTGGLLLDRDSKLQVVKTVESREREMRSIIEQRCHRLNQERLAADRKASMLDQMKAQLVTMSSASVSDMGSVGEDAANLRKLNVCPPPTSLTTC